MDGGSGLEISVVVPTFNRRTVLPVLVSALKAQTLPADRFEVLIVDDGSTDGTAEYAGDLGDGFRLLVAGHRGASAARNLGARHARGAVIAFTDDDCRPHADWLETIAREIESSGGDCLLGHTYSVHPASTFVHSVFKSGPPVVACNFAVRRENFEQAAGFDEHFEIFFEDEDLGRRLEKSGHPVRYVPGMRVEHPSRYQSFYGFLRLRRGLQYLPYMSQKHPDGEHWRNHRGVVRQIRRKMVVIGIPAVLALVWTPGAVLLGLILAAHVALDASRVWALGRVAARVGFPLRLKDQVLFALLNWAVPWTDAWRIFKGFCRDAGRTRPWNNDDASRLGPRRTVGQRTARALWMLFADPAGLVRKLWRRTQLRLGLHSRTAPIRMGQVAFSLDLSDLNMRRMYAEIYEVEEVELLRRLLRPGHVAVDVGANVGYLTAWMADAVGPAGAVHAFEPIPDHLQRIESLARANPDFTIHPVGSALGEFPSRIRLNRSGDGNDGWITAVPGFMSEDQIEAQVDADVTTLDAYVERQQLGRVDFVKIDTEGFEFRVLRGGRKCLSDLRPIVLCEIAPAAYPLMGDRLESLEAFLDEVRYRSFSVRLYPVRLTSIRETMNVVLLPSGPVS